MVERFSACICFCAYFPVIADVWLSAVRVSAKRIDSFSVRNKLHDRDQGWRAEARSAIDLLITG